MRHDSKHKAETRSRIVKAAAREIRLKGSDKVTIADVMASAGLTRGGFYAHFASNETQVSEAIDRMFACGQRRTPALNEALGDEAAHPKSVFRAYLASYLSMEHRDLPDRGCPLPALAADMPRNAGAAQARYALGLKQLTANIKAALTRIGELDAACEANAVVAQLVGAVGLARAAGRGGQSEDILQDNLASLSSRLGL